MLTIEQKQKLKDAGYNDEKINAFEIAKFGKSTLPVVPNYIERVKQGIGQELQQIKTDITSQDNRTALSKGISTTAAGFRAAITPVAEAPVLKQIGQKFGEGIDFLGRKLSDLYSPQFQQELANMPDEEFNKATQTLQDIKNLGDISNTILTAKGGQKGTQATVTKLGQGIKTGGRVIKQKTALARKVAGDIIPSKGRIVNSQVSQALDLTPGDINNIHRATGNEVGRYLADKNLIRGNKADTVKALEDLKNTQYKQVRTEVNKVKKIYTQTEVPRLNQSLKEIQKKISDVPGLEEANTEVKQILRKNKIILNDVQRTKELLDEHFTLYKVTGDVAEGIAKKGLSNLRKELQSFIEKEVKTATEADIGKLNNDVATSRSILDAVETRSPKGLTRGNIKMGDFATFGIAMGASGGNVLVGAAAFVIKKIIESPTIKLKFSRWLDKLDDAQKARLQQQLQAGKIPPELDKFAKENQLSSQPSFGLSTRKVKSVGYADAIKKPDLQLKRNVQITTLQGEKVTIPEGEALSAYEKGGKMLLKDGREYIVSKSQYENIKNNSLKSEAKEFAPELKGTEESVKGSGEAHNVYENYLRNKYRVVGNDLKSSITEAEAKKLNSLPIGKDTKFSQYQLPGGKNYKEVLIKAPIEKPSGMSTAEYTDKLRQSTFKSSHWDEPNVLSHLRLNERTYKGKKVTFMEELQSDWAREARKGTTNPEAQKAFDTYSQSLKDKYGTTNPTMNATPAEVAKWNDLLSKGKGIVGNPLLKNWQELSVKRALKEAVDNNSEYLAWISGEQTSARYNLATHLEDVKWQSAEQGGKKVVYLKPKDGSTIDITFNESGRITKSSKPEWQQGKMLDEVIGKGLSDKIMAEKEGQLSGESLSFGGEWAKNLYDKQVKNIVEDITGGKVEVIDMKLPINSDTGLRGDRTWREIERVTSGGHQVTGLELKPKDLSVGKHISDGRENSGYIITNILGDGKFEAVPKEVIERNKITMNELLNDPEIRGNLDNRGVTQTFDISTKKSTGQQAIKITPEIRALVRGEAPKLKHPVSLKKF